MMLLISFILEKEKYITKKEKLKHVCLFESLLLIVLVKIGFFKK